MTFLKISKIRRGEFSRGTSFIRLILVCLIGLFAEQVFPNPPESNSAVPRAEKSVASLAVKRLVVLGDSLTEGYGVARELAFPALLENKINSLGKKWIVINAGISGSTSASAPSRLNWQLKQKPDLLVLALGANDGLRGLRPTDTEKNLDEVLDMAKKNSLPVLLCGMMMPPNYGKSFTEQFKGIFPKLAKKYQLPYVPFLLEKVAGNPSLNLADGIHPNEKGHEIMAETVFAELRKLL